MHRFILTFVQQ